MPPRPPTPLEFVSASVPKLGNRASENEDAVAAADDRLRFAISDGASEGWESGPWASELAAAFVRRPPVPSEFPKWLAEVRDNWVPLASPESAPWYASVKQEQGSFATLVGLELCPRGAGWAWKAVAVGDSCLVHVRGEELKAAFPLASPAAFGNRPALLASSAAAGGPEPEWFAGRAEPGDLFLLASDAAAARLLHPPALAAALGAARESLGARDPAALLGWCRTVQKTTNDDVSVIAIRLPPARESP